MNRRLVLGGVLVVLLVLGIAGVWIYLQTGTTVV
jgi:hypothetical protein